MTEAGITHYPRWQCVWSADEIARLRHGIDLKQTAEEIAAAIGRTAKSIREKCSALGLVFRPWPESHWSEERIAHCRQLYDDGYSATESGIELGCSRNAVIGIWHRNQFLPRPHIVNGHSPVKKMRARGAYRKQRKIVPIFKVPASEITELPPDQSPCAVTFAELENRHCRWPVADTGMYCGADKIDGYSYCGRHCRIAYIPHKRAPRQGGFRLRNLEN